MALFSGCLVTDPYEFPTSTDYPPEILRAPGGPYIGDIINLTRGDWPNGYRFNVRIRDLNVEQELTARVRLVKSNETDMFESLIVQRGDKPERDLSVPISTNNLRPSECHRLDLVVSGSFAEFDSEGPPPFDAVDPGTYRADASWLIYEGNYDSVKLGSCPKRFEVKMPAAAGRGGAQ